VDGLKFYPDTAESKNQTNQTGITGLRTQKIAVVPTHAGLLTLPELKLVWWNTTKNMAEEITLAKRTIEVLPSLDGNYGTTPSQDIATEVSQTETTPNIDEQIEENDDEEIKVNNLDIHSWKMISIISLLLWVITALFLALRNKSTSSKPLVKKKQSHIALTTLDDIRRACNQNSAVATQKALLNWCAAQPDIGPVFSLGELIKRVGAGELSNQLQQLERSLYSPDNSSWQGKALLSVLKELKLLIGKPNTATKSYKKIPPLHLTDE